MLDSNTAQTRIGNYRWVICALLFFATTINYMDRQVIGILRPVLEKELHWANPEQIDIEYGYITTAFTISYAIGVLYSDGLSIRWALRSATAYPSQYGVFHRCVMHLRGVRWVLEWPVLGLE